MKKLLILFLTLYLLIPAGLADAIVSPEPATTAADRGAAIALVLLVVIVTAVLIPRLCRKPRK